MAFKEFIASIQTSLLTVLGPALPFKEALQDFMVIGAATWVQSSDVPQDEVWEITYVYAETDAAAGDVTLEIRTEGVGFTFDRKAAATWIVSRGPLWLVEGQSIRATLPLGTLRLNVIGATRYSSKAVIDLLHKVRPIPRERDVQAAGPRPDPKM